MKLYTCDRLGSLHEGVQLDPMHVPVRAWPPLSELGAELFPAGLSCYGVVQLYLSPASRRCDVGEGISGVVLNIILEQVRRLSRPDRPSRLASLYACATVEEAVKVASWQRLEGLPEPSPVYQLDVPPERVHRGDLALYHAFRTEPDLTGLGLLLLAHRYWQGLALDDTNPRWEYLVELPVRVGRQVATALPDGMAAP